MTQGSALEGRLVVVTGGSGFLGQQVAQALLARGARVRIAARHPEKAFSLKPLANLGQLQFARVDVSDRSDCTRVVAGADAVVSLVGSFEGNLDRLMGEAPGWLAEAAAAEGAAAFVHVSGIADPGEAEDPSPYACAKRLGERRVLAAFPRASILRPSILFGADDQFVNMFAGLIARLPVLPVFGPEARIQPLFVADCAEAVARALENPGAHGGKIFEIAGPEVITMMDLNRRIAEAQGRHRTFLPVPDPISAAFAMLPGTPMSSDQWRLLQAGSVADPALPGMRELGLTPRPLGLFLDRWMTRYRRKGRFGDRAAG